MLVGITGYFLKNNNEEIVLIEHLLNECASPYVENEIVKIPFAPNKILGIIVPKEKALYDYVYDLREQRGAIVYGYILIDERRVSAQEVMQMDKSEFYKLLEKADGSFLIVKVEKKVWIATDWLGTRPVYYAVISDGIVFSSCFWSVLRFFKEMKYPIKLNDSAILSYLWPGRIGVLNNWTFIEDILLSPPGTILEYDLSSNKLTLHKYYELQYKVEINDEELAAKMICHALIKSVTKILRVMPSEMKKNICVLLSGGLDSRVLIYILSRKVSTLKALTYGTKKCDEVIVARQVTKKLGVNHVVGIYDLDWFANYVHDFIRLTANFAVLHNLHIVYAVKMLLENNCHICFDGFVLDITLGGSFMDQSMVNIKSEYEFYSKILKISSVFDFKELMSIIDSRLKYRMREVLNEFKNQANFALAHGDNYLNSNDRFFVYTRARRWTLYAPIAQRYASDGLLPWNRRELLELIARVDPKLRMNRKVYRKVLLKLNKELALIPYNRVWLPPIFPCFLWRFGRILITYNNLIRKITKYRLGLETTYFDFSKALRQRNMRKLLYNTLLNQESLIYKFGYLRYESIKNMVIEHLSGKTNHGEKIAYIMALELVLGEISKYIVR
jgi:hypothetical protein